MKRTNAPGATIGNLFTNGSPPSVPATVVDDSWLNAVQEEIAQFIESEGITLNGADNTQIQKAVKSIVQNKSKWKASVKVATTANGTLATAYENGDTVDGVALTTGDRILLKDQTSPIENGIYTVNASGAPTRAADFALWSNIVGSVVTVEGGTVNTGKQYRCSVGSSGVVGTNNITFATLVTTAVIGCSVSTFTSSGTWTKATINPKFIRVIVVGAGGGGGNAAATSGTSSEGSGGGGGGTAIKTILAASLGSTETVTVGTGGAALGAGGASSFGAFCTGNGGSGGASGTPTGTASVQDGGAGGTATGGDINIPGTGGGQGIVIGANLPTRSGIGGGNLVQLSNVKPTSNGAAAAGVRGSGGNGGSNQQSQGSIAAGGAGGNGLVIVEEYY